MFKKFTLLTISIATCATSLFGIHDYDAPIPVELKTILDKNYTQLPNWVKQPEWLPGWYIKPVHETRVDRIKGAKIVASAIENLGFADTIKVPEKYSYVTPEGKRFVIAKEYQEDKTAKLNQSEAKMLFKVAYMTNFSDIKEDNFFKDKQGNVVIIDTEIWVRYTPRLLSKYFASSTLIYEGSDRLDAQAKEYLQQRHKKYQFIIDNFLFLGLKSFCARLLETMSPVN
jgi:hypothetical protein